MVGYGMDGLLLMVDFISWRVGIAWLVWEYSRIWDEHDVGAGAYKWATKKHI